MGFSLNAFFNDLFCITENLDLSDEESLALLKEVISNAYQYALDSRAINGE